MHYYLSLDIFYPDLNQNLWFQNLESEKIKWNNLFKLFASKQSSRSFMELPINFEYFVSVPSFLDCSKVIVTGVYIQYLVLEWFPLKNLVALLLEW
jgi:hypothetical protein